jgi:hypothetical protein
MTLHTAMLMENHIPNNFATCLRRRLEPDLKVASDPIGMR